MSIFSNMEKFGLKNFENAKVLEEDKKSGLDRENQDSLQNQKTPREQEMEALFEKHYECPVCDLQFVTKCVRAGKAQLVGKDTDLRPIYKQIDPVKYEVITCEHCGYSALSRYYGKLTNRQMQDIKYQVGNTFRGIESAVEKDLFTYDDAIARYQLALVTCIVKKAKNGERAYTCLKYAWALRGKRETLSVRGNEYQKLYADEMECIETAYEGFMKAISTEVFPIAGMDENTMKYVMADLARRLKRYDEALKLVGSVITSRAVSHRLKDEALNLKELIREDAKVVAR